jgi:hypothetical protein
MWGFPSWEGQGVIGRFSAIHVTPVSDAYDQDADDVVLDVGDNPEVTDAIFPEVPKLRTFQRFADRTRIFELRHAFMKKPQDASGAFMSQLGKFPLGIPL